MAQNKSALRFARRFYQAMYFLQINLVLFVGRDDCFCAAFGVALYLNKVFGFIYFGIRKGDRNIVYDLARIPSG